MINYQYNTKKKTKKKKEVWVNPFIYNPFNKKAKKKKAFTIDPLSEPAPLTPPTFMDDEEEEKELISYPQPRNFKENKFTK